MARPEGLEPPAYWFEANRSIQLSYGRGGRSDSMVTPPKGSPARQQTSLVTNVFSTSHEFVTLGALQGGMKCDLHVPTRHSGMCAIPLLRRVWPGAGSASSYSDFDFSLAAGFDSEDFDAAGFDSAVLVSPVALLSESLLADPLPPRA